MKTFLAVAVMVVFFLATFALVEAGMTGYNMAMLYGAAVTAVGTLFAALYATLGRADR